MTFCRICKYFVALLKRLLVVVSSRLGLYIRRAIIVALCIISSGVMSAYHAEPAQAAFDSTQNQYWIAVGPIFGSTTVGYNYVSAFNPANSGKTMTLSRVRFGSNAVAAAIYQDLTVYRISAVSGGISAVTGNAIPKKNTNSPDSIAEVRSDGMTATRTGTVDSRLMAVVGAGAAGNSNTRRDYTFQGQQLVLQPGEGIVLTQATAGNANQRIFMNMEWQEQATAPTTSDDYMLAYPRVSNAADYYQTQSVQTQSIFAGASSGYGAARNRS